MFFLNYHCTNHLIYPTRTSTIDWCEENYVVTSYIAEAVNTITNAAFIALAVYALINIIKNKHERHLIFVAIGFITVGVGSWMFHATLLYEYQLLDELPMIYATCIPYWIMFSHGKPRNHSLKVAFQISSAAVTLTAIYLHYRNPTIHQTAYGVLNGIIVLKGVHLAKQHVKDPVASSNLNWLLFFGLTSFLSGYALWNADIHLCDYWRRTRRSWGMPWGFLLEGHGWWHLLTGYGVYFYIVYIEYLGLFLNGSQDKYEFIWDYYGFLPHVDLKQKSQKVSPKIESTPSSSSSSSLKENRKI